ncbi:invasion associated locus B family protein [Roseicyclus sp. F158]|uniref:Invasion associated locus B family protein n=1 Tax=Tropicimonas omnivorans TaxID=3075590 RepID=A0ABU3DFI3_9RHOB|nr:invasion associated locus B family protein [Roseicyclus sp. F158]MDT0682477.1 invasion associated locus B family protein [Roseicyclus sp. F158]
MFRVPSRLAALGAAFLVAGAAALPAQEGTGDGPLSPGDEIGRWRVECPEGQARCILSQTLTRREGGALVAKFLVFPEPGTDTYFFAAQVPEGAYLPTDFSIGGAEDDARIPLTWQTCRGGRCEALIRLEAEAPGRLEATDQIGAYRPGLGAEPVVFEFETEGLADGLSRLPEAPAAE